MMESKGSSIILTAGQETDTKPEENSVDEKSATAEEEVTLPDEWKPLPLDPNYESPGYRLYRYRGTILGSYHFAWGLLEQLSKFRGRSTDVIVASFPKSGTTWLQEVVWRVTHHDELADGTGSGIPLEFRFPMFEAQPPKHLMDMAPLDEMADPRFIKTHLLYHLLPDSVTTSGAKVLYVSRDARDVCVSFYHFLRMVSITQYRGAFSEFRDSFMRDAVLHGPYREHVKGYLEHSDTVLCLTYEQMQQDRASVVRKVADFLGIYLTDTDVDHIVRNTSFEVMKANPDTNFQQWEESGMIDRGGTFMRKGVVGDWENHFTEEESESFMKWCNEEVATLS